MLPKCMRSHASFSDCGNYRWSLTRVLNGSEKELIFIGLNPSLGTSYKNDATLRRLIRFTEEWGYGSLHVINLFGKISIRPKGLRKCNDPVGSKNDLELVRNINIWSENNLFDLWVGWGINGQFMNRNNLILNIINKASFRRPYVVGLTKEGHPSHPLYFSKKSKLFSLPSIF